MRGGTGQNSLDALPGDDRSEAATSVLECVLRSLISCFQALISTYNNAMKKELVIRFNSFLCDLPWFCFPI
jgi:hypothetical protein